MKLLICPLCNDVFNLGYRVKRCSCGEVSGRYITQYDAEVNGKGISLAIGNGSLEQAVRRMYAMKGGEFDRDQYKDEARVICWVRPHEGPGNPHTKINQGEMK